MEGSAVHVCGTFYMVRETWEKFGLPAGNMKFNAQNEE
jgi:hypothetical protein